MKPLATDIETVRQLGVDMWRKDVRWPVSEDEFQALVAGVVSLLDELYASCDRYCRALVLSDFRFLAIVEQHLHFVATEARSAQTGRTPLYGPASQVHRFPDWHAVGGALERSLMISGIRYAGKYVRKLMRNRQENGRSGGKAFLPGILRPDALGLGGPTRGKTWYRMQTGAFIDHSTPELLLHGCDITHGTLPHGLADRLDAALEKMDLMLQERLGCALPDRQAILSAWCERLRLLSAVFKGLIRKKLPPVFVAAVEANSLHRIVAQAFREQGKEAITFHHGSSMGGYRHLYTPYNYLASYDTFYCPTAGCARSWERNYRETVLGGQVDVVFRSLESDYYLGVWTRAQARPLPDRIRTVMVMGFPMSPWRYPGAPYNFFAYQLPLALRLVELIKGAGYRVLYKIHPEREAGVRAFFEPVCDGVEPGMFEDTWQQADAFVTCYTASTTFGYCLATDRPVLLLDLEESSWNKDHYDLLRKRCRMVPAWRGDGGDIGFDEQALLDHLATPPERPDEGYLRTYMFPE